MRDVIRRNWRFWVTLAEVLILTAFFAHYIGHRQTLADQRNERQRQAICAILANIPGHIPPEMGRARAVFARPGHPGDCQPIPRPKPSPTPVPTVTATPRQRVVVLPGPTVTRTARPTSHPSATSTKQPSPSPTPSRTCVLILCARGNDAATRPFRAAAPDLRFLLAAPRSGHWRAAA